MLSGMEENKKSGGGDVRAKAPSWDIEREKAKNVFFGFFPLSPTVARSARHSHPSPPEKKAASRKKSRLRRKKTAPIANSGASCVSRVVYSYLWILATTDPPRLIALISLSPSCASGFAFRLHGVFHDMPSPMALLLWVWVWRGWGKRWRGMRVFGVLISRHGIGWLGFRYFTICFLPWKM